MILCSPPRFFDFTNPTSPSAFIRPLSMDRIILSPASQSQRSRPPFAHRIRWSGLPNVNPQNERNIREQNLCSVSLPYPFNILFPPCFFLKEGLGRGCSDSIPRHDFFFLNSLGGFFILEVSKWGGVGIGGGVQGSLPNRSGQVATSPTGRAGGGGGMQPLGASKLTRPQPRSPDPIGTFATSRACTVKVWFAQTIRATRMLLHPPEVGISDEFQNSIQKSSFVLLHPVWCSDTFSFMSPHICFSGAWRLCEKPPVSESFV